MLILAAVEEFQMDGFFKTDVAYTEHWKLAFLSFPPQYLYLVRHSQFPISLLQMVHCHETLHYEALCLQR